MSTSEHGISGEQLSQRMLAALREHGPRELSARLHMHQQTVLAIAAGVPVRPGSLALAERYFRLLDASEGPPAAEPEAR